MNAFNQPDDSANDVVPVYVPKYMLTPVYRFIAEYDQAGPGSASREMGGEAPPAQGQGSETSPGGADGEGPWTVAELRRLSTTKTETAVLVTAMLDYLSDYPDRRFTTTEMVETVGWDYPRFTGSLSAFSRHIIKAYGRKHWPMTFARVGGEGTYMLPAPVAATWVEARSFGPDDGAASSNVGATQIGPKDWSRIERVLSLLPYGKWTTFGEVAAFDHTSPRAVGRRMGALPVIDHAYRVLTAGGRVPRDYHWADPNDTRNVEDVLRSDGVQMVSHVASKEDRLSAADLAGLLES